MHRRDFVKTAGAVGTVGAAGLAGCLGDDDSNGNGSGNGNGNGNGNGEPDFPTDALTWMIPWSEGGGTDQYARQLAPLIDESLGQPVEIDNRPGAGSLVGSQWLTEQAGDGYTFGAANSPALEFTWYTEEIDDWSVESFEPIAYVGVFGYTLVANAEYGITDFGALRDAYNDGELENFAYQGVGSDSHWLTMTLRDEYDLGFQNAVPYDGGGPVMEAVVSDEVPAGFATNAAAQAQVEDGVVDMVVNLMDVDLDHAFPDLDYISNYGDSLAWLTENRLTLIAPEGTPETERQAIADAAEYATGHESTDEWVEETGNVIEYGDMDAAADHLEESLERIRENVDVEAFQQLIEEEES